MNRNKIDNREFVKRLLTLNMSNFAFFVIINSFVFYFGTGAYKEGLIIYLFLLIFLQRFLYISFILQIRDLYISKNASYRNFKIIDMSWIKDIIHDNNKTVNILFLMLMQTIILTISSIITPLYIIIGMFMYFITEGIYIDIIYRDGNVLKELSNQLDKFTENIKEYETFIKRIIIIMILFIIIFFTLNQMKDSHLELYYGTLNLVAYAMLFYLFVEDIIYFLSIPVFINEKK